jgi:hypothetical protein
MTLVAVLASGESPQVCSGVDFSLLLSLDHELLRC